MYIFFVLSTDMLCSSSMFCLVNVSNLFNTEIRQTCLQLLFGIETGCSQKRNPNLFKKKKCQSPSSVLQEVLSKFLTCS